MRLQRVRRRGAARAGAAVRAHRRALVLAVRLAGDLRAVAPSRGRDSGRHRRGDAGGRRFVGAGVLGGRRRDLRRIRAAASSGRRTGHVPRRRRGQQHSLHAHERGRRPDPGRARRVRGGGIGIRWDALRLVAASVPGLQRGPGGSAHRARRGTADRVAPGPSGEYRDDDVPRRRHGAVARWRAVRLSRRVPRRRRRERAGGGPEPGRATAHARRDSRPRRRRRPRELGVRRRGAGAGEGDAAGARRTGNRGRSRGAARDDVRGGGARAGLLHLRRPGEEPGRGLVRLGAPLERSLRRGARPRPGARRRPRRLGPGNARRRRGRALPIGRVRAGVGRLLEHARGPRAHAGRLGAVVARDDEPGPGRASRHPLRRAGTAARPVRAGDRLGRLGHPASLAGFGRMAGRARRDDPCAGRRLLLERARRGRRPAPAVAGLLRGRRHEPPDDVHRPARRLLDSGDHRRAVGDRVPREPHRDGSGERARVPGPERLARPPAPRPGRMVRGSRPDVRDDFLGLRRSAPARGRPRGAGRPVERPERRDGHRDPRAWPLALGRRGAGAHDDGRLACIPGRDLTGRDADRYRHEYPTAGGDPRRGSLDGSPPGHGRGPVCARLHARWKAVGARRHRRAVAVRRHARASRTFSTRSRDHASIGPRRGLARARGRRARAVRGYPRSPRWRRRAVRAHGLGRRALRRAALRAPDHRGGDVRRLTSAERRPLPAVRRWRALAERAARVGGLRRHGEPLRGRARPPHRRAAHLDPRRLAAA